MVELNEEFYENRITEIKYMLKEIEKHGIEALKDIDKPRGILWAKEKLNEALITFEEKLKEFK
ncbi:MAG: hypothetical protein AABY22_35805 [Nanoarchaeota archaeon]